MNKKIANKIKSILFLAKNNKQNELVSFLAKYNTCIVCTCFV